MWQQESSQRPRREDGAALLRHYGEPPAIRHTVRTVAMVAPEHGALVSTVLVVRKLVGVASGGEPALAGVARDLEIWDESCATEATPEVCGRRQRRMGHGRVVYGNAGGRCAARGSPRGVATARR